MTDRPCTCHPDDNPPVPCPQKYAIGECRAASLENSVLMVRYGDDGEWRQTNCATFDQRQRGFQFRWFTPGEES